QQLVGAPAADLSRAAVDLRPGPGLAARARVLRPLGDAARLWRARSGEKPGGERDVERLEVLAPRDERLPQPPVHVVLACEHDRVEPFQRIGDAAGADLDSDLAQHA